MSRVTTPDENPHQTYLEQAQQSATPSAIADKSFSEKAWKTYGRAVSKIDVATNVLGGLEKVHDAVQPFFDTLKDYDEVVENVSYLKNATLIGLPGTVKELVGGVKKTFTGEGVGEKVEGALTTATSVGGLCDHVCTVAEVLHKAESFTKVSQSAIAWTGPLGIASSVLSALSICLSAMGLYNSAKFVEKFKKQVLVKNFKELSDDDLKDQLNISKTKIQKIRARLAAADNDDQKKLIKKLLKGRVQDKMIGYRLAIVISAINVVALGVMLFTPLAVVTYSLAAAAIILGVGKLIYEKVQKDRFKEFMSLHKVSASNKAEPVSKGKEEVVTTPSVATAEG